MRGPCVNITILTYSRPNTQHYRERLLVITPAMGYAIYVCVIIYNPQYQCSPFTLHYTARQCCCYYHTFLQILVHSSPVPLDHTMHC